MNQAITFLTDGGDTVRDLTEGHSPQACHILDWFHITMRLTVIGQMIKSLPKTDLPELVSEIEKDQERVKWYLWHGNIYRALEVLRGIEMDIECFEESPRLQIVFPRQCEYCIL